MTAAFRPYLAAIGFAAALLLAVGILSLTRQRDAARAGWEAEKQAHAQTVAGYRTAAEKARADDLAHARDTEQRYAAIAQERQDDLTKRLAAARADADRYAASLRSAASTANPGGGDKPGMPVAATAASGADRAGDATELDDARACAEAVTKAEGWQEWWASVARVGDEAK